MQMPSSLPRGSIKETHLNQGPWLEVWKLWLRLTQLSARVPCTLLAPQVLAQKSWAGSNSRVALVLPWGSHCSTSRHKSEGPCKASERRSVCDRRMYRGLGWIDEGHRVVLQRALHWGSPSRLNAGKLRRHLCLSLDREWRGLEYTQAQLPDDLQDLSQHSPEPRIMTCSSPFPLRHRHHSPCSWGTHQVPGLVLGP